MCDQAVSLSPFVLFFYLSLCCFLGSHVHTDLIHLCVFFPSTFHYKVSTEAIKFKPQKYYFSSGLKLSSDSISAEAARLLHCDQISSDCLFLWTLPTWRVRQRLDSENTSPVIMSQPRVQKFKCGFFFSVNQRELGSTVNNVFLLLLIQWHLYSRQIWTASGQVAPLYQYDSPNHPSPKFNY